MSACLRQALQRDEFVLHYQPIVSLETGRISACEALVRWRHPERGLLLPDEFIGVAEETGLINPIGEWVLEQACHQVAAWKSDGLPAVRLAVNVSLRQCTFGNLRSVVSQALSSSGLEPHALQLEMTESGLAESPDELLKPLVELCSEGVFFLPRPLRNGELFAYVLAPPAREYVEDRRAIATGSSGRSAGCRLGVRD